MRLPAGDRFACGVPAEDAESRALTSARLDGTRRIPVNTLLAIVTISPFFALPVSSAQKSSQIINLKN
jgi:hypothetical protein